MKISSAFPAKKGRIEIIPLIDIMFFLLASFMLASLAMMRVESIQMALPSATVPTKTKLDTIEISVAPGGDLYVGSTNYNMVDLQRFLAKRYRLNSNVRVYIKASPAAKYGMFINALDLIRQVGIPNVSCAISTPPAPKALG